MIWVDPEIEGYETPVEYGPEPTAFEPGGAMHNVAQMSKTASSLDTDCYRCPECNWHFIIHESIVETEKGEEKRIFTCSGQKVRAYPPL